jgi:SAM-dependent methyltransferase
MTRSAAEIHRHYEVEKRLAARLRASSREERKTLYASFYTELAESELVLPTSSSDRAAELKQIDRSLGPDTIFLELGAGDCGLSLAVAPRVRYVYALEISRAIIQDVVPPSNVEILITDGLEVPVPAKCVTLAYSNQVLEHLHPDDVLDHLRDVHATLTPGGRYICITPNRLTGPSDISTYFDAVPTGLHLREYTTTEVGSLMRQAGFSSVEAWTTTKGISVRVPWRLIATIEWILDRLPRGFVRRAGLALPLRIVLRGYVVGVRAR